MTGTDARTSAAVRRAARIVSIASGKGGVGKTSLAVNLAWALNRLGRSVCLLDADLGLSNVDIYLGITSDKSLEDVLFGGLPMEQAIFKTGHGMDVISGSSGVTRMAELDRERRAALTREFGKLNNYDYLVVDNSPGIAAQVMSICLSSDDIVLVVNPEAASVTDAYAFIKVLKENGLWRQPQVLLNRCRDQRQARAVFDRFNETTRRYLSVTCRLLGAVPLDGNVPRSAALRQPLLETSPGSPAAQALFDAAVSLDSAFEEGGQIRGGARDFWDKSVIHLQQGPLINDMAVAESPPTANVIGLDRGRLARDLRLVEAMLTRVRRSTEAAPLAVDLEKISRALRIVANRYVEQPQVMQDAESQPVQPAQPAPEAAPLLLEDVVVEAPLKGILVICPDLYMQELLLELSRDAGFRVMGGYASMQEAGRSAAAADVILASDGDEQLADLQEILNSAGDRPVLLLEGFQGSPQAEAFRDRLAAVVHRPFRIGSLLDMLRRFA